MRREGGLEGRAAALQALLEEKALLNHEQRERIDDLEAELECAQSAAWEQREMQQQLEAAVQEAQAKMSAQSRELAEMRQVNRRTLPSPSMARTPYGPPGGPYSSRAYPGLRLSAWDAP